MATRGRPPKDEAARKSEQLSVRIPAGLREQLEVARRDAEPERSLSQEIELRLRQSFEWDDKIKLRFGGPANYWLLRLIAEQISVIENQTGRQFWDDKFTFDQVKTCIDTLFDHIKPKGRSSIPKHLAATPGFGEKLAKSIGKRMALLALANVEAARRSGNPLSLPGFADSFAAARHLKPRVTKSAFEALEREWSTGERKK